MRPEKQLRRLEARRTELEQEIHHLESTLSTLTRELELASREQHVARVSDLGREYASVQGQLQHRLEEWTKVAQS